MYNHQTFENAQPGDHVFIPNMRSLPSVYTIERLTPTQIILVGTDTRFRRSDGAQVGQKNGGSWVRTDHIVPADDDAVAYVRLRKALQAALHDLEVAAVNCRAHLRNDDRLIPDDLGSVPNLHAHAQKILDALHKLPEDAYENQHAISNF